MGEPPLPWLLDCSKRALHEFHIKKLNESANLSKELRKILQEWVEERALTLLTEWFMEYGEELIALTAEPREAIPEVEHDALPVAKPQRFEFWRHGERRFNSRRRAG